MGVGPLFDFKKNMWFKFFSFSFSENVWKETKNLWLSSSCCLFYFILLISKFQN